MSIRIDISNSLQSSVDLLLNSIRNGSSLASNHPRNCFSNFALINSGLLVLNIWIYPSNVVMTLTKDF